MKSKGIIYLVGAGPGDPGLLTLRGAEVLGRAEVVACDADVNPAILRHAPKSAEILNAAKKDLAQSLMTSVRAGKTVVRLLAGDPYLFGDGSEDAARYAAADVPFEVVPGISPLLAAPNYAGVPPTHREFASQLTLVDGSDLLADTSVDWALTAKAQGTKVFRLKLAEISPLAERLVKNGFAATAPAAAIIRGTQGGQKTFESTLDGIAALAGKDKPDTAAVLIVGEVVKLRSKLNWFEQRSLFGERIVVTRSREQAGQLSRQLLERGADVLEVPTIKFEPTSRREDLVDCLLELNSYDWLVFTSPNGVTNFFEYFFRQFHDMRDIGGARLAAVGPATANKLKELHLQVDLMPDEALAASIAEAFTKFETIENLKICLLRAEVANRELPEALEALGAIVDDIAVYKTTPETDDATGSAAALLADGADWVAFTSSSTVEQFHARFDLPAMLKKFPKLKIATIGPETSGAVAALGVTPVVEAKQHTIDGLVDAITAASGEK